MCEILLMPVTLINIFGLPYAIPLSMRWRWSCCHYGLGHGIGEGILVVVEVKEALIVVMVLLHLMVVVIGVLRYVCVVQCLGSWTPSVALGILSDSTVTRSAVKISDLHIFKEMEI